MTTSPRDRNAKHWQETAHEAAGAFSAPPTPLFDGPAPPPFPLERAFPPGLADIAGFCEGLATELQVPVDLPAMLIPPIVAVSIAQKYVIEIRPGYREPAAFWTMSLLDSGERKSATFRRLIDPLHEWERDRAEQLAPEIAATEEQRQLLERELQECRRRAAQGSDPAARGRAIEIARELALHSAAQLPTLVTTDTTSEALVGMLLENGERALVASPEGDALEVMLGRYDDKARPNLGVWLKGHSGDRLRVNRRGRAPESLQRPALSVAMCVQPEAVRGMLLSRAAHGRGLLARFFWSAPRGMIGRRKVGAPPVGETLEMRWVTSMRRLLDLELDKDAGPRILRPEAEAAVLHQEFEEMVEREFRRGGVLSDRKAWGAKLCGGIARLAMILHCLEVFSGGSARSAGSALSVSTETMKAALAWAPYLIEHERIAAGVAGCDPQVVVADRILSWLARGEQDHFSRRDCFTAVRGAFVRVVDDIDPALDLLRELGYVSDAPPVLAGSRGGRPPSPVYFVNPKWDRGGGS